MLEVFTNLYELHELTEPLVYYAIAPAVIAAIGLAAQIGGSIYSGIKSKQANEEAKREADKLKREQDEMYRQVVPPKGLMLINIAKQRNGTTGIVFCKHNESINNFFDI